MAAWGTHPYHERIAKNEPTVFMGLYGLPDFYALWRHQGKRYVFWCGSDIRHLMKGYWLEDKASGIKVPSRNIAKWIDKHCESWVENRVEHRALKRLGIHARICPSFMGNVHDYKISYKHAERPSVYASVSGDDFKLYGWDRVMYLAKDNQGIDFHLYGNTKPWEGTKNVIVHGRVPKEKMNKEIKKMQGGLRMVAFDGFSEIIAKSVLWGQWPISLISYPHALKINEIKSLTKRTHPNKEGAEYYKEHLNKFPWCE